jgi:esterase/lipase
MKYLLFLLLPLSSFGQFDPMEDEYKHYEIFTENDTINYHIHIDKASKEITGFILFFQGSGPQPLFQISTKMDTLKTNVNDIVRNKDIQERAPYSSAPFDLGRIPLNLAFVLISKKGIPLIVNSEKFKVPRTYYENESLDYRVWQGNTVINHIIQQQIKKREKVIIIGYSEGSDVVAKLGTINKEITHIGFWSGGGNARYYDFALSIRKEVQKGKLTESQGKSKIDFLLSKLKEIQKNKNSTVGFWQDNGYHKWSKYSEHPIYNLLKITIPIFVTVCGKDESVPIESAYLIPIEFTRKKKENLTFKVYPDYDSSFMASCQNEEMEHHWMDVFQEFIKWTDENK